MPKLQLDLQIETNSDLVPTKKKFKAWAKLALRVDTEFTIRIVDLEEGRMFNSTYRGKDYATNVLTFPLADEPHLMGDIVICAPIVEAEAKAQNKTVEAHYAHLTVHGVLHLHGYDHENEEQEIATIAFESECKRQAAQEPGRPKRIFERVRRE